MQLQKQLITFQIKGQKWNPLSVPDTLLTLECKAAPKSTEFSFGGYGFFIIEELSLLAGRVQVEQTLCSGAQEHALLVVIHRYFTQSVSKSCVGTSLILFPSPPTPQLFISLVPPLCFRLVNLLYRGSSTQQMKIMEARLIRILCPLSGT